MESTISEIVAHADGYGRQFSINGFGAAAVRGCRTTVIVHRAGAALLDDSAEHPGLPRTAMMDVSTIAVDSPDLSRQWAMDWARMPENVIHRGAIDAEYDPEIVGAILLGAIGGAVTATRGANRDRAISNSVRYLLGALRPTTA